MRQNLKAYKKVNIESSILSADPHQIIVMMYDGILESLAQIKGAIERKDFDTKAKLTTKSVNILTALINALDKEAQPKVSENFENLYNACITILNDVSINLDTAGLDEVHSYIKPLRDAWRDMPTEAKEDGLEQLKNKQQSQAIGA